ncbi:hypothetical protein SAY86_019519 [Trapa natans]|uniref:Uncharacterized protein n=1 Tax=Trapa natans TaxID=22666 RepID=A0AAN7LYL8_TRANT|nr:hypothetical protein SAY86_019519 [Trapa natans]
MTGVRIKSWPASLPRIATDIHFEDINNIPSKDKINKVSYKNIKGTILTLVVVKLFCSKAFPCEGVELADINLTYQGTKGTTTSICENITPTVTDAQNPPLCGSRAPGAAATASSIHLLKKLGAIDIKY